MNRKSTEYLNSSLVIPVHKKGQPLVEAQSYRPIHLEVILAKVQSQIYDNRLRKIAESEEFLSDMQQGFRRGRGCPELVLALKELCEGRKIRGKSTFLAFLDVKDAFPLVCRTGLFTQLARKFGYSRLIRAIRAQYRGDRCRVVLPDGSKSNWWETKRGVKTGDPLSSMLFILFFTPLLEELVVANCGILTADGTRIPGFMFADDIVLVASNKEELQLMLNLAARFTNKWRFSFNNKKSGTLIYNRRSSDTIYNFTLDREDICEVKSYKYLGVLFESNNQFKLEISSRSTATIKAIGRLKQIGFGKDHSFSLAQSLSILNTCVRSKLEYASVAWSSCRNSVVLEAIWNKACRIACGVHRKTSVAAINSVLGLTTLRSRWAVANVKTFHKIIRMEDDRVIKKIILDRIDAYKVEQSERKRANYWFHSVIRDSNYLGYHIDFNLLEKFRELTTDKLRDDLTLCARDLAIAQWEMSSKGRQTEPISRTLSPHLLPVKKFILTLPFNQRVLSLELLANSLPLHGSNPGLRSCSALKHTLNSPLCPLCNTCDETLQHFLLECSKFTSLRHYLSRFRNLETCFDEFAKSLISNDSTIIREIVQLWRARLTSAV